MLKSIRLVTPVVAFTLSGSSVACADYLATGYPDPGMTNGRPRMASYRDSGGYATTGIRLSFVEPVRVTGISMVGATSIFDPLDMNPDIVVHSGGGGLSREEAFAASPFVGNAITISNVYIANHMPFGTSAGGVPTFFVQLGFTPFTLPAGDFILSVPVTRQLSPWSYQESTMQLGTAILADSGSPGSFFEWNSLPGYSTGTPAIDINWHTVPSPVSAMVLALGSLRSLGRRRR